MPDESIFNITKELFLPKYGKCRGLGCAFRPIRVDDSRRLLDILCLNVESVGCVGT